MLVALGETLPGVPGVDIPLSGSYKQGPGEGPVTGVDHVWLPYLGCFSHQEVESVFPPFL